MHSPVSSLKWRLRLSRGPWTKEHTCMCHDSGEVLEGLKELGNRTIGHSQLPYVIKDNSWEIATHSGICVLWVESNMQSVLRQCWKCYWKYTRSTGQPTTSPDFWLENVSSFELTWKMWHHPLPQIPRDQYTRYWSPIHHHAGLWKDSDLRQWQGWFPPLRAPDFRVHHVTMYAGVWAKLCPDLAFQQHNIFFFAFFFSLLIGLLISKSNLCSINHIPRETYYFYHLRKADADAQGRFMCCSLYLSEGNLN
jgi:hypothetical protein